MMRKYRTAFFFWLVALAIFLPGAGFSAAGPSITTQPQDQNIIGGSNAFFSVTATGTSPLFYRWSFNGTNLVNGGRISGVTASTLAISNVAASDAGNYQVVVTNSHGSDTSSIAVLTVSFPPTISSQPTNQSAFVGDIVTFNVSASGTEPLSYQWQLNTTNIFGQTNASLSFLATTNLAGTYSLLVTNPYGSKLSSNAVLTVSDSAPVITSQSGGGIVYEGADVTLQITATGSKPLNYQWTLNGFNISGATNSSYQLSNVVALQRGNYQVVVSNSLGSATSTNPVLNIQSVVAWGGNMYGQCNVPSDLTNILAISVGGTHCLALRGDHTVVAWGANNFGQCNVPTGLSNVVEIGTGAWHSMALKSDGTVVTWGNMTSAAPGLTNVVALRSGIFDGFALKSDGSIVSWGGGLYGENIVPAGLSNVVDISASDGYSTMALKNDGTVVAWGDGGYGELAVPADLTNAVAIETGSIWNMAIRTNGTVAAWGYSDNGQCIIPASLTNAIAIEGGYIHNLGLRPDGVVVAWGSDNYGQTEVPASLGNVAAISAGNYTSMALAKSRQPPQLIQSPANVIAAAGNNALLVAQMLSHPPTTYHWVYFGPTLTNGWNEIPGATRTALLLTNVQPSQSGYYGLATYNSWGSLIAGPAFVDIGFAPAVIAQPQSASVVVSNTVSFSVIASGSAPTGFRWYLNNAPLVDTPRIAGSTATNLIISNARGADAGNYFVVVTNAYGSATSAVAVLNVLFPPQFTSQPQSQTLPTGTNFILSANASGTAPLAYQWFLNGVPLADDGSHSGTTSNVLTVASAKLADSGGYSVVVTNSVGSATSLMASVTVLVSPSVLQSTGNQIVPVNSTVSFLATIGGSEPLNLQWYFNGAALTNGARISGATTTNLVITGAQFADSGDYILIVTNPVGTASSTTAVLTVLAPPIITLQPQGRTNATGTNALFLVSATGTQPIGYQWFFNGTPLADDSRITGTATTNLFITNLATNDTGNYQLIATNSIGAATSAVAVLTVMVPPGIAAQPAGLTIAVGSNATFSVIATGDEPLAYQWYFNNTLLSDTNEFSGSATSSLTVSNAQASDTGAYKVVIVNPVGSVTSTDAVLSVLQPPSFTSPPPARSVPPGLPTTFSMVILASGPLSYQWQFNNSDIPGATNATYSIPAVSTNELGFYRVVVSNAVGSAVSPNAKLTFGNVAAWGRTFYAGESQAPPDLTNAVSTAGVFGGSCAVRADGTVAAWGTSATNVPSNATNVVAVAGYAGYVALRTDGNLLSWGVSPPPASISNIVSVAVANSYGVALRAEGVPVTWGSSAFSTVPVGLNHVIAVACGNTHAAALKDDGTVVCWGSGVVTNVPINLTNAIGIAAGYTHCVALRSDGTLSAWGSGSSTNIPVGLTNIAAVFSGFDTAGSSSWNIAIKSNGTITVWGNNNYGETNPPAALTNLISVAATPANYHMLDIVNDGTPLIIHPPIGRTANIGRDIALHGDAVGAQPLSYQWLCNGTNIPGANGTTLTITNVQFENAGAYQLQASNALGAVTSLSAPLNVVSNSALTILGQPLTQTNNCYQGGRVTLTATVLGNGPLKYQWYFSRTNTGYTPVPGGTNEMLVLEPALAIQSGNYYVAVSNQFNYATSSAAAVRIWFARGWGYTGGGIQTVTNPAVNLTNTVAITTSGSQGYYGLYFALGSDGRLSSWATYNPVYFGETNVSALSNSFVTAIAAGSQHGLALKSDGTVYAWGYGGYGQTNPPAGLSGVTAIACGDYHDIALKSDGSIVAWGQNNYGEGTNYMVRSNSAVAIAAGTYHNLGLREDGTVFGWGNNSNGQTNTPFGTTNIIAIAAGTSHSVALRANGTVIGWGNNGNGQITFPTNLTNVVAIAASGSHTTVLRNDGTTTSFGYEYQSYASNNTPVDLANVVAISSGGDHDFGLLGNRAPAFTVQPWTRNFNPTTSTQLVLTAKCAGVQPVSYQWLFNGTNIPGATSDSITLTNFLGQPSRRIAAGNYQLMASNAYGFTFSKSTKVSSVIPLGDSLDAANLNWTSTGTSWYGQTNITHDGVDAARSGGIGALQESLLQTTVATNWPGRYSFWWKVSSEQFFDTLEFRINGTTQATISGEVDWQQVSIPVATGTNVLQWRYSKDATYDSGLDAGFVDQFAFIPDPPIITLQPSPASQTVNLGANVSYVVNASGGTLFYQWRQNATNAVGFNNSTLSLNSVGRAQNGNYFVIVTNSGGAVTSSVVSLKVLVPQLLGAPTIGPAGPLIFHSTDADGGLLSASDLTNFEAQASTNLTDWVTLTNALSLTNGMLQMQDPDQTNNAARFYRLIEH